MKKVAIFVDWENLRKDLERVQKTKLIKGFNYNNPTHLTKFFCFFINDDEEIYRIFFYTAMPKNCDDIIKEIKNDTDKEKYQKYINKTSQNRKTHQETFDKIYEISKKLLDGIVLEPYIALRLGELQLKDIDTDGKPIIGQKQVDMLFGLDISHVSYMKLADNILLFCKDSDMTPALKTARINGLTTVLANLENGFKITHKLQKHCDLIRTKNLQDIVKTI